MAGHGHARSGTRALALALVVPQRVAAATWIGERRWTLRLDNRIDVLLPELATYLADSSEQDGVVWRLLGEVDRLTAPAQDLPGVMAPALGMSRRPVERAELARGHSHIRVVDVARDHVTDRLAIGIGAQFIGSAANSANLFVARLEQGDDCGFIEPRAALRRCENVGQR